MTTPERHAVVADSLAGRALVYSNADGGRFGYTPAEFEVTVALPVLAALYGAGARPALAGPLGWTIVAASGDAATARWRVRPLGEPPTCLVGLRLVVTRADGGESEIVHGVPVEIHGRTQFDPRRHAFPFANSPAEFGAVEPSREIFRQTYGRGLLTGAFFGGLYSRVVFLTSRQGGPAGGLCTGIARSALELSLQRPAAVARDEDPAMLRRTAQLWHGRQLADRALLASALAWLTQGSRAAYVTFRRDVLARGVTEVAMDVHVPRPWRRDLLTAFVGSGHTVVPYALRQASDDRAEVWVYDPNYPQPEAWAESVIHFDLAGDSYRYRQYDGRTPGKPSKVIAVRQAHYRRARTGYLGGLLSLLLFRPPRDAHRPSVAPAAGIAALLAVALGLWLSRRKAA